MLRKRTINGRSFGKRILIGTDIQVCLGCVTKGRSSSSAISRVLQSGLGVVLGSDYSHLFWVPSCLNPCDDPAWGHHIRNSKHPKPNWLTLAERGNFGELDNLVEHEDLQSSSQGLRASIQVAADHFAPEVTAS